MGTMFGERLGGRLQAADGKANQAVAEVGREHVDAVHYLSWLVEARAWLAGRILTLIPAQKLAVIP